MRMFPETDNFDNTERLDAASWTQRLAFGDHGNAKMEKLRDLPSVRQSARRDRTNTFQQNPQCNCGPFCFVETCSKTIWGISGWLCLQFVRAGFVLTLRYSVKIPSMDGL